MPIRHFSLLQRAASSLLGDLRAHRLVVALVTVIAAGSLAAILPVTTLFTAHDGGLHERIALPAVTGSELGLAWKGVGDTPTTTQHDALHLLTTLLAGAAAATLAVGAVTMLVLLSSQESARSGERQVQRAVGASHRLLLLSALLEGLLLGGAAVLVGGIMGSAGSSAALAAWPGEVGTGAFAASAGAGIMVVGLLVVGILFPVLLPARRLTGLEPPRGFPLFPTAFQVAACLIALTTSALIARRAAELGGALDTGPRPVGAVLPVSLAALTPAERAGRYAAVLGQLHAEGRGTAASLTAPGNLVGLGLVSTVTTNCGACIEGGMNLQWRTKPATYQFVSADTFRLLRLPMVAGRGITAHDTWASGRVAVVSRSLAAREFEGGEAIGRQLKTPGDDDSWSTVVGVIDDAAPFGIGGTLQPRYTVYLSVLQHPPASTELLLASAPPPQTAARIRATLGIPTEGQWQSLEAIRSAEIAPIAWFGRLFGVEGWAMLVMAMLGVFVLMQRWVGSVLHELGIRRAVGAHRTHVIVFVLFRAAGGGIAGIGAGIWLGTTIWEQLPTFLAGVATWDTAIVLRYAALLFLALLAGALVPAWRAAHTAPAVMLESPPT